jgi:hypothetical protein
MQVYHFDAEEAVKKGDLDKIKHILADLKLKTGPRDVIYLCGMHGSFELIQNLIEHFCTNTGFGPYLSKTTLLKTYTSDIVKGACRGNRLEILLDLAKHVNIDHIFYSLCLEGHLEYVKYFTDKYSPEQLRSHSLIWHGALCKSHIKYFIFCRGGICSAWNLNDLDYFGSVIKKIILCIGLNIGPTIEILIQMSM